MNPDERARATLAYMNAHQADQEKVAATITTHGVLAARQMMRTLGMPTIPDELCDPVIVLDARREQDSEEAGNAVEPLDQMDH